MRLTMADVNDEGTITEVREEFVLLTMVKFPVQSMCTVRDTAHYSLGEDFSIASTEPRGPSARFLMVGQITSVIVESRRTALGLAGDG